MRAGGIRPHHVKVSYAQAGNYRLERDLNCALRAGRERFPAVMLLGEVDPGSDDLLHGDVRFGGIAQRDAARRTIRINSRLAKVDAGRRNL